MMKDKLSIKVAHARVYVDPEKGRGCPYSCSLSREPYESMDDFNHRLFSKLESFLLFNVLSPGEYEIVITYR